MALNKTYLDRLLITLLALIVSTNTFARKSNSFPHGCESVGFHFSDKEIILNEDGEQTIYFIENNSSKPLEVKYDEKKNVFMSVGWHTNLSAKRWAVFASDQKAQHFRCFEKGEQVSCGQSLRVCQYPRVKFAVSNQGSYWVAQNMSLNQAKRKAIKTGILLRW